MGSESYLSDFRTEGAVKLRIPSSFAIESYVNVASGRVSKGLEDKEESKSNALQLMKLIKKQVVSIEVENENVEETSQGVVAVEEQEDMPELSRLRADCIVYSSNLSIKPEVECMSRMIHDSRVYSDYENYFPNSLEVKVEGDLTKFGDGLFSPPLPGDCTVASAILNGSSMEGRKRSFPNIESYKSNFESCCDNATNLNDNTNVDNQQIGRKMNETWQVNSFTSSLEIDISHQAVEEDISGVQHVVHETSCSVQGSTGELLCCSEAERSTFEKPSSAELDSNGATIDSLKMTSTCCSIDTDCCTEEENVPGVVANTCPITSVRRTNPKRGASIRSNLSDGKFNLPIRIQSDRRKCRRKCGASPYCTQEMFSGVKRQMRNSHRKARLSIWGTVEHLLTVIRQRDELIKQDSVSKAARKSRSKKTGREVNQRRKRTALKCEPSILSSTFIPTSDFHTSSRTSSSMADSEQNLAEKWYASVRSNMIVQPGEKDLESTLTQDICVDNLLSECHGISSRVDLEFVVETGDNKIPSDSGNSPESGVYNPLIDTSMPSATPNFVEPFAVHLPLLTRKIQVCDNRRSPLKSHRRKKTMKEKRERKGNRENKRKREKIGEKIVQISECSLLLSDSLDEGRLNCQVKSNVVKESTMSCGAGGKYSVYSRKHFKIRPDPESFFLNSSVSEITDLDKFNHCLTIQNKTETSDCTLVSAGNEHFEEILPHDSGKKFQGRESTNKVPCKSKSICAGSARHKRKFIYDQQRKNIMTFDSLGKSDDFSNKNDQLDFSTGTTSTVSPIGGVSAAVDAMPKDATGEAATPILSESARKQYDICVGQPSFSEKKAWALCDDCQKWRCVPNELVHAIEKDRWTCKDNVDEAFADCTIPQEKTDEEINNDLGISDEQCYSTTLQSYGEGALPRLAAAAQTTWTRIKSNLFLHRNRRTQAIDEVMVCHCKPPPDGGLGCGEECLNRMLNIECVKGTCPCGNLCSNQQFQKRKYAKFKCLKCGKKGFGLQLEDNVSRGEFLIEYVGEVLDLASYEARLRYYAYRGQKHFYFMTLNGGEVIDACDKGNLGRFINHSCDPNCRTEKWMVNGEVCIGLFALRDIKKGEEITFDYNYVRVFGAAAKKCVCGSAECRGYIGGDPSSSEGIVQDDSDTEDVESLEIEGEIIGLDGMETDSVATNAKVANHEVSSVDWSDTRVDMSLSEQGDCVQKHVLENHDAIHQPSSELDLADNLLQSSCVEFKTDSEKVSDIQPFQEVKQGLSSIQPDRSFYEDVNEDPPFTIHSSLPAGQLSEIPEHRLNTLQQNDHAGHVSFLKDATKDSSLNSASFMHKSSTATYPIEEIRTLSKPKIAVKTLGHIEVKHNGVSMRSAPSVKTKKLPTSISSQHIEGVEEMLNELLDEDGGICRRKDTTRRYLRLLHVTAATGDETKGSMSQSARNLSLILDAMLKTKSRVILVDIINKNGLQMLHNMMKQNRDNFNRTPVLRKLLKVLEFLAEKEILTKEHIFAAAPVSGMESFKESMLKLMKHRDAQVQHIARSFANHWIPRTFHRADPPDRDERQLFPNYLRSNWCQASKFTSWHDQRSSEIDIRGEALSIPTQALSSSTSLTDINPIETENSHKHKCQWDQPAVVKEQASEYSADQFMLCCSSSKNLMRPSQLEPVSDNDVMKEKSVTKSKGNNSLNEVICNGHGDDDDDEMPPGFGSPCKDETCSVASVSTDTNREAVVIGHPQERYRAHLSVSYGLPITLMQQQGTDITKCTNPFDSSLSIAPSMPFRPFPPLPSYPRQWPASNNVSNRSYGNSNYRQANQRPGFPKYGNVRRFFEPQQQKNLRSQRFWSQGGR